MTVLAEADRFVPENPSVKRERIYKPAGWLAVGTSDMAQDRSGMRPTSPEYLKMVNAMAAVHGLANTLLRRPKSHRPKPTLH